MSVTRTHMCWTPQRCDPAGTLGSLHGHRLVSAPPQRLQRLAGNTSCGYAQSRKPRINMFTVSHAVYRCMAVPAFAALILRGRCI